MVKTKEGAVSDKQKVHGSPTKDFFVRMITRDITLADCILDLLDNSIDGARRSLVREKKDASGSSALVGYGASIDMSEQRFAIDDNCGGIGLSDAIDYAFHFGRRKDAPADVDRSIGLYGIGMKRAIFKIGRKAIVESHTSADSFSVSVDVDTWEASDDWDFDLNDLGEESRVGTKVTIESIYPQVAAAFSDESFKNLLIKTAARDYAFIVGKGFSIEIGGTKVPHYNYNLKEGEEVESAVLEYKDGDVNVRIVAGLANELADDIPEDLRPDETDPYGWYVICNDRVVLAGDKTEKTVWGHQNYRVWHPQYNGFAGFVFFDSSNPKSLPWTTTKREVDVGDPMYLRAVAKMKEVTDVFAAYTNQRKTDPKQAKDKESAAKFVLVSAVTTGARPMRLPKVSGTASGADHVTISYRKLRSEVKEVAAALGNESMTAKDVGSGTFDYFRRMEFGKS